MGSFSININKVKQRTSLLTLIFAAGLFAVSPASAKQVTLNSIQGNLTVKGDLIAVEDGFYKIDTSIGILSISVKDVTCEGDCPALVKNNTLQIAGSSAIGSRLMPFLLEGYAKYEGVKLKSIPGAPIGMIVNEIVGSDGNIVTRVMTNLGNSNEAFKALTNPDTQIGMSTRRVLPAEARRVAKSGGGNLIDATQEHVIAVHPVVIMVHPSNPVQAVSLEDLDGIYSGRIKNWSELGGRNEPIIAYGRDKASGIGGVFQQVIFAKSRNKQADSVIVLDTDDQLARSVMTQPSAIGIAGAAFSTGTKPLDIIDQCGITVSPDSFTTKAEEYPIQRRIYLYNRSDNMSETAKGLIDFITTEEADALVKNAGFYNLAVEQDTRPYQGGRAFDVINATQNPEELPLMRELVVDLLSYDRLTTTIRFGSGSAALEAKAYADLDELFDYLNGLDYPVELLFTGFSDADGSFAANQGLSYNRALQAANAAEVYSKGKITNPNGVTFTAKGYGELAPVACNATLEGKRTNRRVEIWIRRQ